MNGQRNLIGAAVAVGVALSGTLASGVATAQGGPMLGQHQGGPVMPPSVSPGPASGGYGQAQPPTARMQGMSGMPGISGMQSMSGMQGMSGMEGMSGNRMGYPQGSPAMGYPQTGSWVFLGPMPGTGYGQPQYYQQRQFGSGSVQGMSGSPMGHPYPGPVSGHPQGQPGPGYSPGWAGHPRAGSMAMPEYGPAPGYWGPGQSSYGPAGSQGMSVIQGTSSEDGTWVWVPKTKPSKQGTPGRVGGVDAPGGSEGQGVEGAANASGEGAEAPRAR
jgi:hypothetical protein